MIRRPARSSTALGLILAAASPAAAEEAGWTLLKEIGVEEFVTDTSYEVKKTFPAELAEPVEGFSLTGYAVGLWSETGVTEFILISDMGFCPFCGNPEHGTAVQVQLDAPLDFLEEGTRVSVTGVLEAVHDPETTQSVRLTSAALKV